MPGIPLGTNDSTVPFRISGQAGLSARHGKPTLNARSTSGQHQENMHGHPQIHRRPVRCFWPMIRQAMNQADPYNALPFSTTNSLMSGTHEGERWQRYRGSKPATTEASRTETNQSPKLLGGTLKKGTWQERVVLPRRISFLDHRPRGKPKIGTRIIGTR